MIDIVGKGKKLFNLVSVLPASRLDSIHANRLNKWIEEGRASDLDYMKSGLDRTDPRIVFPDVRTVVVVARFYSGIQEKEGIARFAQGGDYHRIIKRDLYKLLLMLQQDAPELNGRAVVDSAPIFEKAWAVKAGFGWVGRNSLVVNPHGGSFFNIGILLLDKEYQSLEEINVCNDLCENCRRCIDSCPMHAIGEDRMIDTRKCISRLTVEKTRRKEEVTPVFGWIYGCDECQICCPFNR